VELLVDYGLSYDFAEGAEYQTAASGLAPTSAGALAALSLGPAPRRAPLKPAIDQLHIYPELLAGAGPLPYPAGCML
jgi:hypothetical protein